jgi:hypothetical protein
VVNYIHLKPVRAGVQSVETLGEYELSSFPKFFRRVRPPCLTNTNWLELAGGLQPTLAGMRCYQRYLAMTQAETPADRATLHRELCRGWYIGTREGRSALARKLEKGDPAAGRRFEGTDRGQSRALALLEEGLRRLGKTEPDLQSDRKLAAWKVVLAAWIKQQCAVTNRWFGETLHMGNLYGISKAITQERRNPSCPGLWRTLGTPTSKA